MTFILVVALLWGLFLTLFVLSPLINIHKKTILQSPKNNQHKLNHWIEIKDQLFLKLATGACQNTEINSMSESDAQNYLCDTCEKLEDAGHSWKPVHKESGKSSIQFVFILLFFLVVIHCTGFSWAASSLNEVKNAPQVSQNSSPSPIEASLNNKTDVMIPPPFILPESGYWIPSVNQYILVPAQGILHVYYVGMFSNKFNAKGTKILLPFPKGITDVSIQSSTEATLEKATLQTNNEIILNTPLKEDVNQIQAEFSLPANTGTVSWKKNSLPFLPGATIIMMSSKIAQFTNFPSDFRTIPSNNSEIQYVRVGESSSVFPEFQVAGIVPSRFFLYLLILFFVCIFISAFVVCCIKLKS